MATRDSAADGAGHPYLTLIRRPEWRRWAITSRLGLLTISMGPLGLVLAGRAATGSFAAGGVLAGANALGQGLSAPLQGRRLDRRETRSALTVTMVTVSVTLAALAVATAIRAPLPILLAAGFVSGVAVSGIPGGYRALLPGTVDHADVDSALTIDATLQEIVWILGPALVSLIVYLASPALALATMAGLGLLAAAGTASLPARPSQGLPRGAGMPPAPTVLDPGADLSPASVPSPGRPTALAAPSGSLLADRQAMPLYLTALGMGFAFGGVDFGFAPLARSLGASAAAGGILVAVIAGASGVSGLIYGTRRSPGRSTTRVGLLLMVWALLLMPFALAESFATALVCAAVAGLPVAPLNSQLSLLIRDRLPAARQAEAFSIVWSAATIGTGVGSVIGGALIGPAGVRSVFVALPAMTGIIGVTVALMRSP